MQAAKDVVLSEKPVITDDSSNLEPLLLEKLLAQISTLASVYHKPADTFVSRQRLAVTKADELQVGTGPRVFLLALSTAQHQAHHPAPVQWACHYKHTML